MEEILDKNPFDHLNQLRKLFIDAKQEASEIVNIQLNKFKDTNQIGKFPFEFYDFDFLFFINASNNSISIRLIFVKKNLL